MRMGAGWRMCALHSTTTRPTSGMRAPRNQSFSADGAPAHSAETLTNASAAVGRRFASTVPGGSHSPTHCTYAPEQPGAACAPATMVQRAPQREAHAQPSSGAAVSCGAAAPSGQYRVSAQRAMASGARAFAYCLDRSQLLACWDAYTSPPLPRCCWGSRACKPALPGCCGRGACEQRDTPLLHAAMASGAEPAESALERLSSSIETLDREDGRISSMPASASAAEQVRHGRRNWGPACALRALTRGAPVARARRSFARWRRRKWRCVQPNRRCRRRWLRSRNQPRSSLPSACAPLQPRALRRALRPTLPRCKLRWLRQRPRRRPRRLRLRRSGRAAPRSRSAQWLAWRT